MVNKLLVIGIILFYMITCLCINYSHEQVHVQINKEIHGCDSEINYGFLYLETRVINCTKTQEKQLRAEQFHLMNELSYPYMYCIYAILFIVCAGFLIKILEE